MFRKKNKGSKNSIGDVPKSSELDPMYNAEDNKRLLKLIEEIKKPSASRRIWSSPSTRMLLTVGPECVYDRLFNSLAVVNLVHTLILSTVWGAAAEPLDVSSLPEDQQMLGDLFNLLNLLNVAITVVGTLITAYLMLNLNTLESEGIYRALVYLGPYVIVEFLTFVVGMLCLSTAIIAFAMNTSSSKITAVGIVLSLALFGGVFMQSIFYGLEAFPATYFYWAAGITPPMATQRHRATAERVGNHIVYEAAFHLGDIVASGGDLNDDGVVNVDDEELERDMDEEFGEPLRALVRAALPRTSEYRRGLIARAMLKEDLTVQAMRATLEEGRDGATVLFAALDLEESGQASQLRRGERLSIIGTLRQEAALKRNNDAPPGEVNFNHRNTERRNLAVVGLGNGSGLPQHRTTGERTSN